MARVVHHSDVEQVAPGGALELGPDDIVTPLALERATERGVRLTRAAPGNDEAVAREVARRVMDRMGTASPELLEVVAGEVSRALGAPASFPLGAAAGLAELPVGIEQCARCVAEERRRGLHRAVLTTTGRNTRGIVARITGIVADLGGDILDISQTLVGDYFTMIIVIDAASLDVPFGTFKEQVERAAHEMGLQTMMMHEDVIASLHRV